MIIYYLKTSFRNFKRHLTFPLTNSLGLAVGFLCLIIIALWIDDEINFDNFYSNSNRIYKVFIEEKHDGKVQKYDWTSFPVAEGLTTTIPEIENATCCGYGNLTVKYKSNIYNEGNVCFTDESFFKIFDFPFTYGDNNHALSELNSIIISEKAAKKYFGTINAIGYSLLINHKYNFTVSGVIQNIPTNSNFQFDFFIRAKEFSNELASNDIGWESLNFQTFLMTKKNSDISRIKEKMRNLMVQNIQGSQQFLNIQPLKKSHLYNVNGDPTNFKNVFIFSVVAFLTLLIAYTNFINLSIACYQKRILDFNIKKVIGSDKKHLFFQIFTECFLIVLIEAFG